MKKTFKEFTLIKKNVDDETIEKRMDFNLCQRVIDNQAMTRIKWEARKAHIIPKINSGFKRNELGERSRTLYPKTVAEFINLKTAMCQLCGVPCSLRHMMEHHRVIFRPTRLC